MVSDWLNSWMCTQSWVHGYRGTKDTGLTTNYTWTSTSRKVGNPNPYAVNGELYTETSIQKSLFIFNKEKKIYLITLAKKIYFKHLPIALMSKSFSHMIFTKQHPKFKRE